MGQSKKHQRQKKGKTQNSERAILVDERQIKRAKKKLSNFCYWFFLNYFLTVKLVQSNFIQLYYSELRKFISSLSGLKTFSRTNTSKNKILPLSENTFDIKNEWWKISLVSRKKMRGQFWARLFLAGFFFIAAFLLEVSLYLYYDILPNLPEVSLLVEQSQKSTTKIFDRNSHLLYNLYEDENRTPVKLSDVSFYMQKATLAIEDREFYNHQGFSVIGMSRALRNNFMGEKIQGGSTITQQLVKNRLLNRARTMDRKVKELILSLLVENAYEKDQILEMYLNDANYGGTIYGIEQAAVTYFGKNAKYLTLGEATYLAGITTAPSVYSPYAGNMEGALLRRAEVLRRMVEDGYVSAEEAELAKNEELDFKSGTTLIAAPHFVFYVKDYLTALYGEEMVNSGGLEIITTLDLALQNETEQILIDELNELSKLKIGNGAVLITNPQSGEVLTMLGSRNYWDRSHDGEVNVTTAKRQPGSSIKPLTYALAFTEGKTPATLVDDVPFNYIDPSSKKSYSPKNYDGKYHGRITLRESLGSSYNIPAVKVLYELGVSNLIDFAQKMGITTWTERKRYGLSLALGAAEVRMTDLSVAYGSFANGGYRMDLNPILEVKDIDGKTIYKNECALSGINCPDNRVLSAEVAYQLTSVLTDNDARTPAFGPQSVLTIPDNEVAVKTGTTNNLRDNWTIGYTSDRLVAVWVGNNDNQPMSYVASGITGASPVWQKTMKLLLDPEKGHVFDIPANLISLETCNKTGLPKCNSNCQSHLEYFAPNMQKFTGCTNVVYDQTMERNNSSINQKMPRSQSDQIANLKAN